VFAHNIEDLLAYRRADERFALRGRNHQKYVIAAVLLQIYGEMLPHLFYVAVAGDILVFKIARKSGEHIVVFIGMMSDRRDEDYAPD
jgi:uncharacterized protein YfaT (DUF1175 family)